MPLYSVRLLIRCTGKGQPARVPLYEDRVVLVRAKSHETAKLKARRIVNERSTPYKNALGNMVYWRVASVCGSAELFDDEFTDGKVKDGAQVYWRCIRSADPVTRLKREGTMNSLC
jgi:hypothetical protein